MKKKNYFWIGYSDLMTSMFFVMLVLFIVTVGFLLNKMSENLGIIDENKKLIDSLEFTQTGLIHEIEQANKLLNMEALFSPLNESNAFQYLPECRKYIVKDLMGEEIFEPGETVIKNEDLKNKAVSAGKQLEQFLARLIVDEQDIAYLLVIEGNMANTWDRQYSGDNAYGYRTSYQRALALYELWQRNGINFRKYNVEVMICGSGFNGLCRDDKEENNKRFSIQIIPKVSR